MAKTAISCLLIAVISQSVLLAADTRCQCDEKDWEGDCIATVEMRGSWIRLTSDTTRCSRVEWYAEADRQLTIVIDGEETIEWRGQATSLLTIQGCKICKEDAGTAAPGSEPPSADPDPGLQAAPYVAFHGTWRGVGGGKFGNASTVVQIRVRGSNVTGTFQNGSFRSNFSGSVEDDDTIVIQNRSGGKTTFTLHLTSPDSIQGRWKEGKFQGKLQLQRG